MLRSSERQRGRRDFPSSSVELEQRADDGQLGRQLRRLLRGQSQLPVSRSLLPVSRNFRLDLVNMLRCRTSDGGTPLNNAVGVVVSPFCPSPSRGGSSTRLVAPVQVLRYKYEELQSSGQQNRAFCVADRRQI